MSALFNLFYIYDPWLFHFFRMAFFCGVIASLVLAYRVFIQKKQSLILPLDSIAVCVALIVLSALPMLLHGSKEYAVIIQYTKGLILFLFGVAIYNLFYAHSQGKHFVIRDLKIGIGVQALVGFLALAGIPFMIDLSLSTNVELPRFYGSEQEYRLYNITSMAFFQLSIFYLMLMHFLLAYNAKHNSISSIFLFLLLFIGLISGRTFLFLSVLSILLYFKWRYIPALLAFFAICLFLAINFAENRYVFHALEPLINILKYFGKGSGVGATVNEISQISSSSENLVKNHLYLSEIRQILFGDGFIGLISGRTFLFLSVLSILLYFKWRYIPALLAFFAICLFLAINFAENRYVFHALEPLINILKYFGTGSGVGATVNEISQISSSSENLVKNHLYLPEIRQILFGDGFYYTPEGRYYGATDSGFIRQVLYGGIAYLALCFLFTAYFVYRIAQNWFDSSWKFILSTLAILSILNIKADTYAFPGIMLVLLMFLSLFGNSGKQIVLFSKGEN